MRDDPAETTPAGGAAALRCSSFARSEDLDPVGSAGSYRGIVLAEIPLPWPGTSQNTRRLPGPRTRSARPTCGFRDWESPYGMVLLAGNVCYYGHIDDRYEAVFTRPWATITITNGRPRNAASSTSSAGRGCTLTLTGAAPSPPRPSRPSTSCTSSSGASASMPGRSLPTVA